MIAPLRRAHLWIILALALLLPLLLLAALGARRDVRPNDRLPAPTGSAARSEASAGAMLDRSFEPPDRGLTGAPA